jgi:hypothetical protein
VLASAFYLNYIGKIPNLEEIERDEFIDLSLSILNLMIAILAIVLAVAGFWGCSAIREAAIGKASEVADQVAREVSQQYSEDDGDARTVERFAAFLRLEKEQNKNIAKPANRRKPVSRPTSTAREEDKI